VADLAGTWESQFDRVASALSQNLDSHNDIGASVCVISKGVPVVDIWGGHIDTERSVPWERDTIVNVWSTSKAMTSLCALMLADRGDLDFWSPVARYWPEFSVNGKQDIEVRHVMGHTAGLSGFAETMRPEDLADWEKCASILATQEPWWEPGTASGYHFITQGYLIGEVVRRITGASIGEWLASEMTRPLVADFHIGLPAEKDVQVSPVLSTGEPDASVFEPGSIAERTLCNPFPFADLANQEWWRRAEIPAINGHGNARSVALLQSVVAGRGQTRGVRLLSEPGCDAAFLEQANCVDLVLGVPIRIGMGYGLSGEIMPGGPRTCFWGCYGGSLVVIDQELELTVSYVMNNMEDTFVGLRRCANVVISAAECATAV
jgi:CubicO group peptidase (beta-lactamase class C family)